MNRDLNAGAKCESDSHRHGPSQLFLLRVWQGERPGPKDCQGVLQQTVTGEQRYFRNSQDLIPILLEFVSRRSDGQSGDAPRSEGD